jgi:hypothetical protein
MVKIEVDLLQNEIETYIQCRDSCIACRYYDDFQIKSNFLLLLIYQKKIFGSRTGIYLPRVFVPAFFLFAFIILITFTVFYTCKSFIESRA